MRLEIGAYAIRDWSLEDAPALARHADNPKIAENLRDAFPHPYGLDDARRFLERVCASEPRMVFAIASEDEAIGGIGLLRGQDVHRYTAEMGYWLSEAYWGRGIMTHAVRALSDWAFDELGLHRIHADPYADTLGSVRVLEKAGYVLEGRMRASAVKSGSVRDQLLYARVREGLRAGTRA